jgi:hypothetical protein
MVGLASRTPDDPSGVVKGESVRLTTTQVSLIAAGIALAAPAITYRANARLDRDRWVRERRAEAYVDALAVLGRIAAHVTDPSSRPHPFDAVPGDQWRVFQARVEAFASAAVVALRNDLLGAWNGYRAEMDAEMDALDAAPDGAASARHRQGAERYRVQVRGHYETLIAQVRQELRQGSAPGWRRWLTARPHDETRPR